jgi:RND superfamily putative drug exporter
VAKVQSFIARTARWSALHPWRTTALWLAFVVLAFVVGGGVGTRTATGTDTLVGEAGVAAHLVEDAGLADGAAENVLITARSGQLDPEAALAAAAEVAARLRPLPQVESVAEPVPAPDGTAVLVRLTMVGDIATAAERVPPLVAEVEEAGRAHPGLRVEMVGDGTLQQGFAELQSADLNRAALLSAPLTLVIMLLAFGAIIAAGVPVLLALSTVAGSLGLWALASQLVPDPGPVLHVIVLIGMAVGVDYSLFYIKREREERARGAGKIDAIELAAATSGRAAVVAGFSTIVAMTGLYLAGDVVFSAMATGAILVVAVTMLGSVTVLPAMLAGLGRLLDRPRVPLVWRLTDRGGQPRFWSALLRPALRYPVLTLLIAVAFLGALAMPALNLQLKSAALDDLPRAIPEMQTYDRLVAAFPSEGNVHLVVVRAPAERAGEVQRALEQLVTRAAGDPLLAADQSAQVRTSTDGRVHLVEVATPHATDTQAAKDSLADLRDRHVPETVGALAGVEHAVGGVIAADVDYTGNLWTRLPWVVGAALLLTLAMMAAAFRSITIAVITILLNALSAAAAFGLVAWIFQGTWAEGLLGFQSTGHVVAWVPVLLFVVLLGLSMDYHVFIVSRIRELTVAGMATREAVPAGITRTAGVVTSAATVMVLVFSLFAVMSFLELKQIGIGLMAAILIDATIVRVLALPALMVMLGRFTWWPSRLSRRDARPEIPATVERDRKPRAAAVG